MINFLGFFEDVGDTIIHTIRVGIGYVGAMLYELIDYLYSVFIYVGKAEILQEDFVQQIYRKVGMILGVFMLFKLVFSLIQSLISPEKMDDKKNGVAAIVQRCVIAVVLLGITPGLFREAYKLQNVVIDGENGNVLYKLISSKNSSGDASNMGRIIASDLYFTFFTDENAPFVDEGMMDDNYNPEGSDSNYEDRYAADDYATLKDRVERRGSTSDGDTMTFYDTVAYLSLKDGYGVYKIEYNWILSIGFAAFTIYILFMFCIQVGIRVVQLAYLQIIAPIPILSYISDPDGSFKKWTKQCFSTYLDLFLRLIIIYFVVTVIGDVISTFGDPNGVINSSTGILGEDWFTRMLVKTFIIIGLLLFAKRVPELLKDLFPGSGSFNLGLNAKKTWEDLKTSPLTTAVTKPIGWMGIDKGAKWLGNKAVEPWKKKRTTRKENTAAYREQNKLDKEASKVWNEYGNAFQNKDYEKTFSYGRDKDGEYAKSYRVLENASDALKNYTGDTGSAEYRKLLAAKDKAEKNHNINRDKYKELARREDNLKRYKNRHPEVGNSNQNNNSNSVVTANTNTNGNPAVTVPQSQTNFQYASQEEYNKRINSATERLAELYDGGASDDEIGDQLNVIRELNDAKKHSNQLDIEHDEMMEKQRDGWMSQGGADDSDNW